MPQKGVDAWLKSLGKNPKFKEWTILKLRHLPPKLEYFNSYLITWPLQNIGYLDLSYSKVSDVNFQKLSEICPNLSFLTAKMCGLCSIKSTKTKPIVFLLLKKLDVSKNQDLEEINITTPSLKKLYIEDCPKLSALELGISYIENVRVNTSTGRHERITHTFQQNHLPCWYTASTFFSQYKLHSLPFWFADNSAQIHVGPTFLHEPLSKNTTLTQLNLSGFTHNNAGATEISNILRICPIKILKINDCKINDSQLESVSAPLQQNQTLTNLEINGTNNFTDLGLNKFVEILNINTTLTEFSISPVGTTFMEQISSIIGAK